MNNKTSINNTEYNRTFEVSTTKQNTIITSNLPQMCMAGAGKYLK